MISDKTKRWIGAVIRFLTEQEADVACPNCENGKLRAMDIRLENEPGTFERIVYCPECGEKSTIRCREK